MKKLTTELIEMLDRAWQNNRPLLARRIGMVAVSLFMVAYLIPCLMAPGHTIRQLNRMQGLNNEVYIKRIPATAEYLEMGSLAREKAFLESRMVMAGSDSIGIVLNLRDSLVRLEINGIGIHTAALSGYRVDKFFFSLTHETCAKLLSEPMMVMRDRGTIVKEPVFVRKAPKDTTEAANFIFIPDTLQKAPVYITFHLSHGIRLSLYEEAKDSFRKNLRKMAHNLGNVISQSGNNISALMHFRIPVYEPVIIITLAGKDITTIYRALPDRAKVSILI